MADVTGPIGSLPGSHHSHPEGTMCDSHPDRVAVARVQGETDSFGSEMIDMCAECLQQHKDAEPNVGHCDWCDRRREKAEVKLRPARDYEEGTGGPVYYVCEPCITSRNKRAKEEADAYYSSAEYLCGDDD